MSHRDVVLHFKLEVGELGNLGSLLRKGNPKTRHLFLGKLSDCELSLISLDTVQD